MVRSAISNKVAVKTLLDPALDLLINFYTSIFSQLTINRAYNPQVGVYYNKTYPRNS